LNIKPRRETSPFFGRGLVEAPNKLIYEKEGRFIEEEQTENPRRGKEERGGVRRVLG